MGLRHFVQGTLTFFFRVCIVYIFKNIRFDVLQISCARKPARFKSGNDTHTSRVLTKYSKCAGCFF